MSESYLLNRGFLSAMARIRIFESKMIKQSNIDITQRELMYIAYIAEQKKNKDQKIIRYMGVSKGAFSNAIKLLENKGFIKKIKDNLNNQQLNIMLTLKGNEAYKLFIDIRKLIMARIKKILTSEEIDQFIKIGTKLWEGTNDIEGEK